MDILSGRIGYGRVRHPVVRIARIGSMKVDTDAAASGYSESQGASE